MFEYEVAISFAGAQRPQAEAIAQRLRNAGATVFYDADEQADLWGKDLYAHLADIYEKKAKYCLMLVSGAYAARVWTSHERRSAQARALREKGEYILPVRFDDTEIPGLPDTIAYLRFQDHGIEGVCNLLLRKLGKASGAATPPEPVTSISAGDIASYMEQRKMFSETEVIQKIWSIPHWRIWICPTQYRAARFRDVDHCLDFVRGAKVAAHDWRSFPWSSDSTETAREWAAGETDEVDSLTNRMERWVLCRSGQFALNRSLDEIPQLRKRTHVLEILDTTTPAVEFAARMVRQGILTPDAVLSFELREIDGRALTWPADHLGYSDHVPQQCWCQDRHVIVSRQVNPRDLETHARPLALELALELYGKFAWSDPPRDQLAAEQQRRFGAVQVF